MLKALAWLILASPVELPEFLLKIPGMADAFLSVCQEYELADSHIDYRYARSLYRSEELWRCPRLANLSRFPYGHKVATDQIAFNVDWRRFVDAQAKFFATGDREAASYWLDVQEDGMHRWKCWDALRDASTESWSVVSRRYALSRLKDLLGEDDWFAGKIPPPVPYHLFKEIK